MSLIDELTPVLRTLRDEDKHYVRSSWLLSCHESAEWRRTPRASYFLAYGNVVDDLLERSTIAIAAPSDAVDTDMILGWMAVEGSTLHYVHVKKRWRKMGLASWLLADLKPMRANYTHMPSPWFKVPADWSYQPQLRRKARAA